jgi:hypothetical protein
MAMDDGIANDMVGTSPYVLYTRERACLGAKIPLFGRGRAELAPMDPPAHPWARRGAACRARHDEASTTTSGQPRWMSWPDPAPSPAWIAAFGPRWP